MSPARDSRICQIHLHGDSDTEEPWSVNIQGKMDSLSQKPKILYSLNNLFCQTRQFYEMNVLKVDDMLIS